MTSKELQKWADSLSASDKRLLKSLIIRLYIITAEMRVENGKE